jgi:ABC-type branched-subunit amino acid transport system substrate-binding protein
MSAIRQSRVRDLIVGVATLALIASGCSGSEDATSSTSTVTIASTVTTESPSTSAETSEGAAVGVDRANRTITLGILADLTGEFAALANDVTDAHVLYWDILNDEGGIDGWAIDVVVKDTRDDVARHRQAYEELRSSVVAISQSTGSSTNIEALSSYLEDDMLVIPLSWYSGWAIPSFDGGVMLEQNTNYCFEAMNVVDFIVSEGGASIAIASADDDYGRDAAAGVRIAGAHYGIPIVYDGTGVIASDGDVTEAIRGIAESGADWAFVATSPPVSAQVLAGAARLGFTGLFTGPAPSYDNRLLDSASAELYDTRFYQSSYTVAWGDAQPGNLAMMEAMRSAYPDRRPSDAFIVGWNAAITMRAVLERAIATGDLTRAGMVRAAGTLDAVDFGGSAPPQSYAGIPNEYVNRQSAIYKPSLEAYVAAGGVDQRIIDPGATTGSNPVRSFFVGEATAAYDFTRPCYQAP